MSLALDAIATTLSDNRARFARMGNDALLGELELRTTPPIESISRRDLLEAGAIVAILVERNEG